MQSDPQEGSGLHTPDDSVESWTPAFGYEGFYEVSSLGRVKRVRGGMGATAGRILKPRFGGDYYSVQLSKFDRSRSINIHTLVYTSFYGAVPPGKEVNHKDGVKENNALDNLEPLTPTENKRHAVDIGLFDQRGSNNSVARLTEADIPKIWEMWSGGAGCIRIAKAFNVAESTIRGIIQGKRWTHVHVSIDRSKRIPPTCSRSGTRKAKSGIRSKVYMAWIRTLPCATCASVCGIEAAHTGERGFGQKSSDFSCIPLCYLCHREGPLAHHKIGKRFWEVHRLNREHLVAELNQRWAIIQEAKKGARLSATIRELIRRMIADAGEAGATYADLKNQLAALGKRLSKTYLYSAVFRLKALGTIIEKNGRFLKHDVPAADLQDASGSA